MCVCVYIHTYIHVDTKFIDQLFEDYFKSVKCQVMITKISTREILLTTQAFSSLSLPIQGISYLQEVYTKFNRLFFQNLCSYVDVEFYQNR